MSRLRVLAGVVLAVCMSLPAGAVNVPTPKYSYYPVNGRTPAEIYAAILKRGPVVDGARALASTSATAQQDGSLTQGPSSCRISDYQLKLDFVIRLPRIRNESVLPPADRALWRQFSRFLKDHELQHTRLWIGCAQDLEDQVMAIKARSCSEVTRKATALWKKLVARCDKRQAAFDAEQRTELLQQPFMRKVLRSGGR